MKDVDLGEPTSFFDHVSLGCTQRECHISKNIVDNYRSMCESRNSSGATEKLSETKSAGKPVAETISSLLYDVEGQARRCVERYLRTCEQKHIEQLYTKSKRHAWMTINSKKKKMDQLENCLQSARKLLSECLYIWHVLVGLMLYDPWTHLLVLSLTLTRACDKRLGTFDLYTFVTHVNASNIVMWENTAQQCR